MSESTRESDTEYSYDPLLEDDLLGIFRNLTMAPPELKSEHLKMVPVFSGEVELLSEFISICETMVKHFYDEANADNFQNIFLMSSLRSKIKGEAKLNLSSYNITNWRDLKTALLSTYGDKRDCYTLTVEMCGLTQTKNESPFEFHSKIQKYINLHSSFMDTHEMSTQNDVRDYVSKLGLRTFLRGLKEPLGALMRTKNPRDLGEALNILTNDFQIDAVKKPYENNNNYNSNYNKNKPYSTNTTEKYIPPHMQNKNNHNNSTSGSGLFNPFRNNNSQQNINKPQSGMNKNQGNNNTNVWNRSTPGPSYRPTPMSAMTTNPRLNNLEMTQENYESIEDSNPINEYGNQPNDTDEVQDFREEASDQ